MNYMILPLKRYFDFKGRSRRKEYWMFVLFVVIGEIVTMIFDSMLGLGGTATTSSGYVDGGVSASANFTGGTITTIFICSSSFPASRLPCGASMTRTNRAGSSSFRSTI